MRNYLLVALGGALGSMGRFWLASLVAERFVTGFPWGTLLVNVLGSFFITGFVAFSDPSGQWLTRPEWRTFVVVGLCGGFTTFSSFSLQTLYLLRDREWAFAGLNILGSVALCLLASWLGLIVGTAVHRA